MPGTENPILKAALILRGEGINPVPLLGKNPSIGGKDWMKAEPTENRTRRDFGGFNKNRNVGILTGQMYKRNKSGEMVTSNYALVDIDLDCDETRDLATYFLPPTDLLFGRGKMPVTHMLYRIKGNGLTIDKFEDPVRTAERKAAKAKGDKDKIKSMLVEIRGSGFQSMVPPSKHPDSGEILQWVRQGKPGEVNITDLRSRVAKLAAAALLVRYYPAEGSRWNASISLAGVLLRNGWSDEEVVDFSTCITLVATGEDMRAKREADVRNAAERLANDNGPVKGWPSLIEYYTERVAQQIGKWLGLPRGAANKADSRFYLDEGCTFSRTYNKKGEVNEVQLANFSAIHTATIIRTDGADSTENLEMTVKLQDGQQRTVTIPSDKFAAMDWVVPALSANNAYLCSGPGVKDAMSHAIQALSGDIATRYIYTHTGWRKIGDTWVFLFEGGALGANGLVPDISVELPEILRNVKLTIPPAGKKTGRCKAGMASTTEAGTDYYHGSPDQFAMGGDTDAV